MSTVFKSIREEVLEGCNMSFRKGLETLRLAAHNTRAYWAVLKSVFAVGSTRAHQLARRFGLDPDRLREGRVVDMGEGCYCNACDSYHCAQCGEVTAHSADCGNCADQCEACGAAGGKLSEDSTRLCSECLKLPTC